jgi:methionyl-tRNA formyltransferase
MSARSLRVVLAAEESAGVQALERILSHGAAVEIVLVCTSAHPRGGRRALVAEASRRRGLETVEAELVRSSELAARLRDETIDLLVNVHSLFIVHPEVLAAPRLGCFNLHPGPLPEYAGLNTPSWAIYHGETAHGVTLHWMEAAVDAGPIAWIERFELRDDDTGLSASAKCVRQGVPLIERLVETALKDPAAIPRVAQDRSRRRYFPAGPPAGGLVDWSRPAAEIGRFVRAAGYGPYPSPWGHPTGLLGGRRLGIARVKRTQAPADGPPGTVHDVTDAGALVSTADELLLVERVWVDGRSARPATVLRN